MLFTALFLTAGLTAPQDVEPDAVADDRLPLAVLYAGDTQHERAQHWLAFLREHFTRVGSVFLNDLSHEAAASYDVVLIDWRPRLLAKGANPAEREPQGSSLRAWLPVGFTRPVVAIGATGGELGPQHKFEWF
jgi:hypothetical protein